MKKIYIMLITTVCLAVSCGQAEKESCNLTANSKKISYPFAPRETAFDTWASDSAQRHCLENIFTGVILNTPLAYDTTYKTCQAYHGEDDALTYAKLQHENTYLVQISHNAAYTLYLLHHTTGLAMEGEYYDILFTLNSDNQLVDHLIGGALGNKYIRELKILSAAKFAIYETTGREETVGPTYDATLEINNQGHFVLAQSTVENKQEASSEIEEPDYVHNTKSYNDIICIESGKTKAALTEALAPYMGVEYLEQHTLWNHKYWVAAGPEENNGVADFVCLVIWETGPGTDKSQFCYHLEGYLLPGGLSADLAGGQLKNVFCDTKGNITLTISRDWIRPGGDPETGEPVTTMQETEYDFTCNEEGVMTLQNNEPAP